MKCTSPAKDIVNSPAGNVAGLVECRGADVVALFVPVGAGARLTELSGEDDTDG